MEILRNYLNTLRREYASKALPDGKLSRNPFKLFEKWFEEAVQAQVLDPHAMILSTVSSIGEPSSRVVLLRSISKKGLVFYTNYDSRKGEEMAFNKNVSLTFFWVELNRQIHVEGVATKEATKPSDKYFSSRPRESQLAAWASPQSEVIKSREDLEAAYKQQESKYKDKEVPRPPNWGGYLVKPSCIEFWQGRPNRLHDRFRYTLQTKGNWKTERLAP